MKQGFIYTRWLLSLTFVCLMGLLAVGMMTVHSKRTLRALAVNLDRKETEMEELSRRHDIVDAELASSLNPVYLKQLIEMAGLDLGPPREDRIIMVPPSSSQVQPIQRQEGMPNASLYRTRIELANNDLRERERQ